MKSKKTVRRQGELEKPKFGGIYRTTGSQYLYITFNYFKQRLRFPSDRVDNLGNREELTSFMNNVGEKIRNRTLKFAEVFYWLDDATKAHFSVLEGRDFNPEPEHVLFGDFTKEWMETVIPAFSSLTNRRDYRDTINSRLLPHFGNMTFAMITAKSVHSFIDNLSRCNRTSGKTAKEMSAKPLSVKRVKSIITPLSKIWVSACNQYNWNLKDPFFGIADKYAMLSDRAIEQREKKATLRFINGEEDEISTREVFLLDEWKMILGFVDPHFHVVMDLLMMGMIGSELEALMKQYIRGGTIQVRCAVTRDREGVVNLKFKPKNWYRSRDIPITRRLRKLLDRAAAESTSADIITFSNDISIPASEFVLTMKDGSPFNYDSFRKTVWNKALIRTNLPPKIPYASRHTFVQWSLLIGVAKTRLVDLMGHSTKKMIDEVYGKYRQGLVDERELILDYLGEDFLALEELRTYFPDRYRERMAVANKSPGTEKAPAIATTFGQSFGQSLGLHSDNYTW